MTPYRAGSRVSQRTGETIFVFEFKRAPSPQPEPTLPENPLMDTIESFIADLILKAIHKAVPNLQPADDAKVTKVVADFVTTGMDLASVYFALRAAKAVSK
jgi:hypothetical protein